MSISFLPHVTGVPVRLIVVAGFLSFAGCSSSTNDAAGGGSTSVSGNVGSYTLAAVSAVAVTFGDGDDGSDGADDDGGAASGISIAIADKANSCSAVHDANSTILAISIVGAIAPGSYPIGTGTFIGAGQATANISTNDATCSSGPFPLASSGTVTVTSASGSAIHGTFDLTFTSTAGHLTGSFDAPICSTDPTDSADGGLVCNP